MRGITEAYYALSDVYIRKSFVSEAIKKQGAALSLSKGALRLTYGVIEHNFLFEYQLSRMVEKMPKPSVSVLIKMGMFAIRYMDDIPDFAAVDEIVKTARAVGKSGVSGFINAVLRRYAKEGKELYPSDSLERLSVDSNRSLPIVKRYVQELGEEKAAEILLKKGTDRTHVRASFSFGKKNLITFLSDNGIAFEETEAGALVSEVGKLSSLFSSGNATVMSLGSAEIAEAAFPFEGDVLDACAAPGGKSVYIAERSKGIVIACDKYPHRAELIRKYAERMKVTNLRAETMDSCVFIPDYEEKFGLVLLDAPCSGLGTVASNPDVVLNRTPKDIDELIAIQRQLLSNVSRYVKKGGKMIYSTCSDLPSEDGENVARFLSERKDFALLREKYTETNDKGGEGYYFAVMERK